MSRDPYSNWKAGDINGFHTTEDSIFINALTNWCNANSLRNVKRIIDFGCGIASAGILLSKKYKSITYHGVDNKEQIVEAANKALVNYPYAEVFFLDMVTCTVNEVYDAALDSNALDMLREENKREMYLENAYNCLKSGAPMLFFFQPFSTGKRKTKAEYESEIAAAGFIIVPCLAPPNGEYADALSIWAYKPEDGEAKI